MDAADQENLSIEIIEQEYADTETQIIKLQEKIRKYQTLAMQAKEQGNPELLSNTLIRLARVNTALGSRAAYAKYIARNADRVYRRTREGLKLEKINKGAAIGKAESMAYTAKAVETAFQTYSAVQLLADDADDMSYRTDTFMKMSQSGLSLIKHDLNDGRR